MLVGRIMSMGCTNDYKVDKQNPCKHSIILHRTIERE
jgi:hypothetical protein